VKVCMELDDKHSFRLCVNYFTCDNSYKYGDHVNVCGYNEKVQLWKLYYWKLCTEVGHRIVLLSCNSCCSHHID
jgi:hypothetical protein